MMGHLFEYFLMIFLGIISCNIFFFRHFNHLVQKEPAETVFFPLLHNHSVILYQVFVLMGVF